VKSKLVEKSVWRLVTARDACTGSVRQCPGYEAGLSSLVRWALVSLFFTRAPWQYAPTGVDSHETHSMGQDI